MTGRQIKKIFAFVTVANCLISNSWAQLKLPAVFADSMVLQQKADAPIWGWTTPGQNVTLTASWSGKKMHTVADNRGRWMIKLATPVAGGPYTISIESKERMVLRDVLVGEVWICSGQSNMEMPVSGWSTDPILNSAAEIAAAKHPSIRMFTVEKEIAFAPKSDLSGNWATCSPATVGAFSATAYFFGRELYNTLKIPVGLIHTSWGGTIAEAWTSETSLRMMKDFDKELDKIDSVNRNRAAIRVADSIQNLTWTRVLTDRGKAYSNNLMNDWKTMQLPGVWENAGLPDVDGIVWFKKVVNIPESWVGKDLKLNLGPIDDRDITYFNGQELDSTMQGFTWAVERHYTIPGKWVRAGENIIAVKVIDDGGTGGIYGTASQMILYPAAGKRDVGIPLSGEWYFKLVATKPQPLFNTWPNQPSVLYNSMIAPLVPFAIKGAIWYQGESNVGRARQYTRLFPLMINDWRKQWGQGTFPFYFVQIAPFKYGGDQVDAAQLRDAQRRSLSLAANTGMAVTLDIGNNNNIHPANKQDVGKRLALWALNNTYNKASLSYSGPLYRNFEKRGNKIVISFTHTYGGLKAGDKGLQGFEVRGADGVWKPAKALIDGDKVIIRADETMKPVGVRYAFYATSVATLFNDKGLPASSFTSDALN
ncbi:sialate O-acetylesterase [Niabella yanshanensis]|uniref:Sialate O-acetylesterase n=1 Tax=Niabella yanshanensis TaxID=577386 RepID=A0ABZ0WAV6_9BACT|nr:sialate O-acetylesterase [Niabella yanshanensis]WQD39688.1 sialate O-acetylesterase [Niabella yanshanensis]